MRIVHVSAYDRGGAANAAIRLHRDLLHAGYESQVVVAVKTRDEPQVLQVPGWLHRWTWPHVQPWDYRLGRFVCPTRHRYGGLSIVPGFAAGFIESLQPDIVHLHWVANSFLSIEQIGRIPHPVVWTLHDMWALTPGYGYRLDARESLKSIAAFQPLLPGVPFQALGENIANRKRRAWRGMNSSVVGPSHWMAEEARRSEIFRDRPVCTIPYALPLDIFKPAERRATRRELGLPEDGALLLFGADGAGARKGFDLLAQALEIIRGQLPPSTPPLSVVLFGAASKDWLRECSFEVLRLGAVQEERKIAALYAACDVFACPSREDNLPNTVLESLACGTPVVGFRVGGLPDLVQDGINGFLAAPFDVEEFARQVIRVLEIERTDGSLGRAARTLAEERYTSTRTSLRYGDLYRELMSPSPASERR